MIRKTLVAGIALFIAVICPMGSFATAQQDPGLQDINQLVAASGKAINGQEIMAGFANGDAKVKIIINLAQPAQLLADTDWDARDSVKTLQAGIRARVEPVITSLAAGEFKLRRRFENQASFSGEVTRPGLVKLANDPRVLSIEPDRILEPHLAQGIPLMNASLYRSTYNGSGVAIAICDTGIDYNHPRLGGGGFPNSKVIGGYDTGDDDSDPIPNGQAHGTCCAGIAAGNLGTTGDYIGGVAYNAKLYALKVSYGSAGSAYTSDIVDAWNWCITHKNDDPSNPILVISTSFGGSRYFSACDNSETATATAANNAVAAGITVLASSGNDGYCDSMAAPACVSNVMSVGAVYDAAFGAYYPCVSSASCATKYAGGCLSGYYAIDNSAADMITSYSNTASFLTLLAPSNQAYTTDIAGSGGYSTGDYYSSFGGTSAACPYAAGTVACLQSANKYLRGTHLTPNEVRISLTANGDNVTDSKVAITKPRVNLGRAIDTLAHPPTVVFSADMDTDPGWTTSGQWAWGTPTGTCGDPSSGYTGTNVYGYNLSGCYERRIGNTYWLTTPAIDCTAYEGIHLKFYRWLGVQDSSGDYAYISVSNDGTTWTDIWSNGSTTIEDTGWLLQVFDISAYANNQPTVYIRWGMGPTNNGFNYCGWNIDDVQITGRCTELAAPTGVAASDGTYCDKVRVTWGAVPGAASYKVYRSTGNTRCPEPPLATGVTATTYDDTTATPGITYYYSVEAAHSCSDSSCSTTDAGLRSMPPGTPTGVSASDGTYCDKVLVTWNTVPGAISYKVYRSTGDTQCPEPPLATGVAGTTYDDTSASPGVTYHYSVKATNICGDGICSATNVGLRGVSLNTPTGVNATDGAYCDKVRVTWNAASGAVSYNVYRSSSDIQCTEPPLATGVAGTTYDDTTASPGETYYYSVKAFNTCGEMACSTTDSGSRLAAPEAPINVQAEPMMITMPGGCTTLSAMPGAGGDTVEWFTSSGGGTPMPGGASPTVCPTATTAYSARTKNTSTGCLSLSCATVIVRVGIPGWAMAVGHNEYGQLGIGEDTWSPGAALIGNVAAVAAGTRHSLVLRRDGTVWASGDNNYGQLGDGTTTHRYIPIQVSGLTGVTAIAGGGLHNLALKSDGTVWAWGSGALGDGTTTRRLTPVQVLGLTGVVAIAAGDQHSLALKADGKVWAWGYNYYGQVGDGTTTDRSTPVLVLGLTDVVAIAAGKTHSLAVKSNGTVWAWGNNDYGKLGDGTTTGRTTAVQVSGLTGVVAAAGGGDHSLAVKSDGTVWAWGDNYQVQLGDGTATSRSTPVQVLGMTDAVGIAAGETHSVAVKSDGTVWAWGYNNYGQLGDGTTTNRSTAVQVSGASNVVGIAVGDYYSLAIRSDGTVWAWGYNYNGQFGDGMTSYRTTAAQVSGLADLMALAGSESHSLALKTDGTLWAWGYNNCGQLGDGTTTNRSTPVQVSGLSSVVEIAGGHGHSLAIRSDGKVWAWGYNYSGKLGDGTTTDRPTPVQVLNLSEVVSIAAGSQHSLALKSDGTVWAWGNNFRGQLGDGTTIDRKTPVQVLGLTDVVGITAGESHSLAVKADGTAWAWGDRSYGKLGNGTSYGNQTTPVQVPGLTGVAVIAAGSQHSLAVKFDGTAWAWGSGSSGQLGNGSEGIRYTPVQVSDLTGVNGIVAGVAHSLALKSDGTAWAWGSNFAGKLGDGTTTQRLTPVQVSGLTVATDIATGDSHSLFLNSSIDQVSPSVIGTWPAVGGTESAVQQVVISFNELVKNVSTDDLVLSAGQVISLSGDGPYVFTVTGLSAGQNTATLDGDITDSEGNDLPAHQWQFANSVIPADLDSDGDVDSADANTLSECLSGPQVPHDGSSNCQRVDFDHDGDADQEDFGLFQRCYSGPGAPADVNCAN